MQLDLASGQTESLPAPTPHPMPISCDIVPPPPGLSLQHENENYRNSPQDGVELLHPMTPAIEEPTSSDTKGTSSIASVMVQPHLQYAEVASLPGPWLQQRPKRRSHYRDEWDRYPGGNTTTPGAKHDTPRTNSMLKGAAKEKLATVYVRNIEITDDDNDETISNNVRGHCLVKGVKIVRTHVIYNRYNDYIVGCKLTVIASQQHH